MRTVIAIFNILIIITAAQTVSAQWQIIESPINNNLNAVCYSGTENIFIVCDGGVLLKSENSGLTWTHQQLTDSSKLTSLLFLDESIGFITGNNGKCFRTENGGSYWVDLSINHHFNLTDIEYADNGTCISVGSKEVGIDGRIYFLPAILTSSNYGETWIEKQFDFRGKLNSAAYIKDGNLLAVGDAGLILRSTDYGDTWSLESQNISTNFNSVKVCPDFTTVVAGDSGTLLYSYDMGTEWESISLPYYYKINDICFNGNIIAACSKEVRIDGRIYYMATVLSLIPGSNDWTEELSEIRGAYNNIHFCNSNKGAAVGDNGTIAFYHYPVSTNSNTKFSSKDYQLQQNYPNPFNPDTKIRYSITHLSRVQIKVYDILGREIITLVDQEKPAGTYELTWNASDLPGGAYFYKLKAGFFVETKKMILLK